MIIDTHRLVIRNYDFESNKVNSDRKYVFLTDLHSASFGKANSKLIKMIDDNSPDAILISGDMYTAIESDDLTVSTDLIKCLSTKYRIYYANGNHERKTKERTDEFNGMYDKFRNVLNNCNVFHLENETAFDNEVAITGLDLEFKYYKKFLKIKPSLDELNSLLKPCDNERLTILLAHNPEYFDSYSEWGADIVLSGHYHGGLVRLPFIGGVISPRYKLFPKYDFGVYKKLSSKMVLSCGIGAHTLPIRMFNPGEISIINIKSTNK